MALEIERRFLLAGLPEQPELTVATAAPAWQRMRQGYLAIDNTNEVRLREIGDCYSLSVKNGSGLAREEIELPISEAQFSELWPLTAGRQLEKRRMEMNWRAHVLIVDEYLIPVHFLLAEVEFDSQVAADAFIPPDFFGPDVTEIATMRTLPVLLERLQRWKATGE